MKMMNKIILSGAFSALAIAISGSAMAAGTAANTQVDNNATIDYEVAATAQPQATSNTASFLVDRRVSLIVSEVGASATVTASGVVNRVTTFTVQNTTNAPLDFNLTATQNAGGPPAFGAINDNFNMGNVRVFVDNTVTGTIGSYDAGDAAIFIDELAADQIRTVFVVADVPIGQANNSVAVVNLIAQAREAGLATTQGVVVAETVGVDSNTVVDTVFGDIAGTADALRDGRHSAADQYNVVTATIGLVKSIRVISDPFNGTTNPKAIPGAVMEYCLQVQNTGSAAADNIIVNDTVPTNTTYFPSSIFVGGTVTSGVCDTVGAAGGTTEDDNNTGVDETDGFGGSFAANSVRGTAATVGAGVTRTVRFRVTVQ